MLYGEITSNVNTDTLALGGRDLNGILPSGLDSFDMEQSHAFGKRRSVKHGEGQQGLVRYDASVAGATGGTGAHAA